MLYYLYNYNTSKCVNVFIFNRTNIIKNRPYMYTNNKTLNETTLYINFT